MKLNHVIDRFALISGIQGEELSKWIPVCIDALEEIRGMATSQALSDEASCRRLSSLAGAYAYYKFTLFSGENEKSVSTGSLSITRFSEARDRARELFEREKAGVRDLIENSGDFCFRSVKA
ncbi:MAG: hypothetical protein Q4D44_02650 [Eubacteriales bacterium]|nr:hypothetical protein [Eubacteriales bacterium]